MDSTNEKYVQEEFNIIRGMPISTVFKKETVEEAMDYVPHDGDVIIGSYPKTGTTWLQYIIQQVISKGEVFPEFNDIVEKTMPVLELAGPAVVDALKAKPRVYRYHLPYNMVKKNLNAKIVYIYRKPEDTFISYYHFICSVMGGPLNFEQYFEDFVTGNVSYGRYFEHVKSFLEHKDNPNMFFISYEKLKLNTKEEILKIARFLGQEYYDLLQRDESVLSKILEYTSFEYMKKNLTYSMPEDPAKHGFSKDVPQKKINFFRKGTIGDGRDTLSVDKLNKLREVAEEVLKDTDVLAEWYGN